MASDAEVVCFACFDTEQLLDIYDTYLYEGKEEVYGEMMKECFSIEISEDSCLTNMCLKCVLKLRDAYSFRQNIITNYTQLFQKGEESKLEMENNYHEEIKNEAYEDEENIDDENEDHIEQWLDPKTGMLMCIKTESVGGENAVDDGQEEIQEEDKNVYDEALSLNYDDGEYLVESLSDPNYVLEQSHQTEDNENYIIVRELKKHQKRRAEELPWSRVHKQIKRKKGGTEVEHKRTYYKCDICTNMVFKSVTTFDTHMRLHKPKEPYQCEECGKLFGTFYERLKHIEAGHHHSEVNKDRDSSNGRIVKCTHCNITFSQAGLKHHLSTSHNVGDKPYSCKICDKKFFFATTLKYHMAMHSDNGVGANYDV